MKANELKREDRKAYEETRAEKWYHQSALRFEKEQDFRLMRILSFNLGLSDNAILIEAVRYLAGKLGFSGFDPAFRDPATTEAIEEYLKRNLSKRMPPEHWFNKGKRRP